MVAAVRQPKRNISCLEAALESGPTIFTMPQDKEKIVEG
jgi:hypothetical protein